jgi:hypothetical protein
MKSEALAECHVHEIVTVLPLFLQLALVLFFFGVMEFLRNNSCSFSPLFPSGPSSSSSSLSEIVNRHFHALINKRPQFLRVSYFLSVSTTRDIGY